MPRLPRVFGLWGQAPHPASCTCDRLCPPNKPWCLSRSSLWRGWRKPPPCGSSPGEPGSAGGVGLSSCTGVGEDSPSPSPLTLPSLLAVLRDVLRPEHRDAQTGRLGARETSSACCLPVLGCPQGLRSALRGEGWEPCVPSLLPPLSRSHALGHQLLPSSEAEGFFSSIFKEAAEEPDEACSLRPSPCPALCSSQLLRGIQLWHGGVSPWPPSAVLGLFLRVLGLCRALTRPVLPAPLRASHEHRGSAHGRALPARRCPLAGLVLAVVPGAAGRLPAAGCGREEAPHRCVLPAAIPWGRAVWELPGSEPRGGVRCPLCPPFPQPGDAPRLGAKRLQPPRKRLPPFCWQKQGGPRVVLPSPSPASPAAGPGRGRLALGSFCR